MTEITRQIDLNKKSRAVKQLTNLDETKAFKEASKLSEQIALRQRQGMI